MLDPDYGWHVGMGRYILENGIPKTDPFSYTMPSYPFVDHEWLLNILFYWADNSIGKNGLAIIFGLLAFGALYLTPRWKGWELGVILATGIILIRTGVRPQVLDWVFIVILWRIFENREVWNKWRWGIIPGFVLWTNLHGGYAIGILMLLWMIVCRQIEERTLRLDEWGWWLGGLGATLLNPYGWRIWWEVGMQITDRGLQWNIAEWQPFYTQVEPSFWFLALLWLFITVKTKQKTWWKITTVGIVFLAGLKSLRHTAIFAVLGSQELPRLIDNFWKGLKQKEMRVRAGQVYLLFLTIGLGLLGLVTILQIIGFLKGGLEYPKKAVLYLQTQEVAGNIFSDYGWGGYLIWKYPQQKVFIDGRMPSWRWVAPNGEADMAMDEYKKVYFEGDFRDVFSKYDVQTVVLPVAKKRTTLDEINFKIEMGIKKWMKIEKGVVRKNLVEELIKEGWVKVYEDGVVVVYRDN